VTNAWAFDLNIEFHETIKQRCFPVETRSTKSVADLSSLPDGRPAILVRVILAILPVGPVGSATFCEPNRFCARSTIT
jgi:hypothetical protein